MKSVFDFSGKKVLVVGGSSGIGNGIAQAFRRDGADVHIWGTRESARSYEGEPGSDLVGLGYTRVNVADSNAIETAPVPFDDLVGSASFPSILTASCIAAGSSIPC